jgi:murein DD-endopeptidase MepM/ murein hydrolase activator NlpD
MRRLLLPALLAAPLVAALPLARTATPAAAPSVEPEIVTSPARPVEGTLFEVRARWPAGAPLPDSVRGELAGEPLHFAPADAAAPGELRALAAVPLDAPDTLVLALTGVRGAARERWSVPVPVARGEYRHERLRVAPRFGGGTTAPAVARRIARESARAMAVARASHDTPRLWSGAFAAPRPGRVTSPFGRGREYNGAVTGRHTGTDLAGAVGAVVRAPARGVVRIVDAFYLGGNVVYLDHGAGLTTAYLHLSRASVAVGNTVERGAPIGAVGATGRVTGPHLHWIVRYGTVSVDGARAIADSLP